MGSRRPRNAGELAAAVGRLTGDSGSTRNETLIYRLEGVVSCDGDNCPLNIQIGKRTFFDSTSLNQVADACRFDRDRVEELLSWTPDELREWLSQYPAEVLKSRPTERKWVAWRDAQQRAGEGL